MKPRGDDAMAGRLGRVLDRTPIAQAPPKIGVAIGQE